MPDYTKCCIYKLCCKDPMIEDCYIGSTTNVIKRRQNHKKSCTNPNDKEGKFESVSPEKLFGDSGDKYGILATPENLVKESSKQ